MSKVVIINARFLTQRITGVQRFGIEICKQLKKRKDFEFIFVAPRDIKHQKIAKDLGVLTFGIFKGHLWEQFELPIFVKSKKGILVSLANTAPILLRNQYITIHDLGVFEGPEWYSKTFSVFYRLLIPPLINKSKVICTVSQTVKTEIINRFKVEHDKIAVIYNGLSKVFLNNDSQAIVDRLPKRYILCVASLNPRKNIKNLIEAFNQLEDSTIELYIVGAGGGAFKNQQLMKSDKINYYQNVTDLELKQLYANAQLFVLPSYYEGFGIPIIEALSQGTPVAVSDISVFREICGEYATYFNPMDVSDIASKIKIGMLNRSPNRIVFEQFSWARSTDKLLNQLNKVL